MQQYSSSKNFQNYHGNENPESYGNQSGFCELHSDEIITNFCTSLKCLMPLCPECIPDHYDKHANENTKAQITSMKTTKIECGKKIKATVTALNQEIQNCELQYLIDPEATLNDRLQKIAEIKDKTFQFINSYFVQLEESLKNKVHENVLKSKGIHSINSEMNSLISELNYLGQGLNGNQNLQVVKKICMLDVKKLFDKFKKDIHTAIDTRQLDPLEFNIDEPNGYQQIKNSLETLVSIDGHNEKSLHPRARKLQNDRSNTSLNASKENFLRAPTQQKNLNFQINITVKDYYNKDCKFKFLHFFKEDDNTFNYYDLKSPHPRFERIPLDIGSTVPNFHKSLAINTGEIFVIGGVDPVSNKKLDTITFLELDKFSLSVCAKLKIARSSHSLCYIEPYVYIVGGLSNSMETLKSCEKFHVDEGTIEDIANLKIGASSCTVTPFNQNFLIKIGGSDENEKLCNVIEIYDIKKNTWEAIRPKINSPQDISLTTCCGASQLNDTDILVFGGYLAGNKHSQESFVLSIRKEGDYEISRINEHTLPFPEGFWNNNCPIQSSRLWALQNKIEENSKGELIMIDRRLLEFDGLNWKTVI